ncbi:hypothetical protein SPRA44_180018 [Serratia proteamaculans]|uniref:hypothetical protein n=1 Tax=Serratia proteamaculans TaxID=28151 RepID=UPI0009F7A8FC|nr:hypothetical protein [Serratia proteamaculans]SMB27140.1 hypothetical protein SPRA44_180018 [Serratia proteamaculans]
MVPLEKVIAALAVCGIEYEHGGSTCRAAMLAQPQNEPQNIPNNIPDGLSDSVNRLLDCDGTRGHFSAPNCSDDDTVNMMNAYRAMLTAAPEGGNG